MNPMNPMNPTKTFTSLLMITTALLSAGKDLALLTFYVTAHLLSGCYTKEARRRARATRLWSLLQATGTERKVLLFEYLIFGPVGQTFGTGRVMEDLFGAITEPDAGEGPEETLNVLLATRYDDDCKAAFYLEAILDPRDPNGTTLAYQTLFTPFEYTGKSQTDAFYALWPDSTLALISYYGTGAAELEAVGYELDDQDEAA